jgi:hypothetical protein
LLGDDELQRGHQAQNTIPDLNATIALSHYVFCTFFSKWGTPASASIDA